MIRQTRKRLGPVLGVGRVTPRVLVDKSDRSQTINRVIVHNQDFRDQADSPRAWRTFRMEGDVRAHEVHSLGFKVWKSHHRVGLGGKGRTRPGGVWFRTSGPRGHRSKP